MTDNNKMSIGGDETKLRTFVAAIPFCRNICDYTNDETLSDYLTKLLHVKLNTETVTIADCWNQLKPKFDLGSLTCTTSGETWVNAVYRMADNIIPDIVKFLESDKGKEEFEKW